MASLLLYLALAFLLYAGSWRDPFHLSSGGNSDPQMSMWFLEWDALALERHLNPLYSALVNHPAGINLMWNPARFLQGWLLAPLTLTAGPVFSYNLSQVLALGLSAWTASILLQALTRSRPAAFAGGLLYGFSPYMLGHAPIHSDFTFLPIPPLVLYVFWRLGRTGTSPYRWGALLGALGAAQFLAAEEVAATMALLALLGIGVLAFYRGLDRELLGRGLRAVLVAAAVAALVIAVPVAYQFAGPQTVRGDFHGPGLYVTDLLGFVVPTSTLLLYPSQVFDLSARFAGGPVENTAYLGLPLLALLGWTAWTWRSVLLVRWTATMLLLTALLSMGPFLVAGGRLVGFPLPWLILVFLPLYGSVVTARLMAYAYLFAAIVLAWFLTHLPADGRRRVVAAALLALAALSLVPRAPLAVYPRQVPAFFADPGLSGVAGKTLLVAPFASDPGLIKSDLQESGNAMLWQAASGMAFSMPEGYAWAPGPGGQPRPGPRSSRTQDLMVGVGRHGTYPSLCQADREQVLGELRSWGVEGVVVGPMRHRTEMVGLVTALLGAPPEEVGGVDLWRTIPATAGPGCTSGS